jgi:hypothetical protein
VIDWGLQAAVPVWNAGNGHYEQNSSSILDNMYLASGGNSDPAASRMPEIALEDSVPQLQQATNTSTQPPSTGVSSVPAWNSSNNHANQHDFSTLTSSYLPPGDDPNLVASGVTGEASQNLVAQPQQATGMQMQSSSSDVSSVSSQREQSPASSLDASKTKKGQQSNKSKHSQKVKYFCEEPGCQRSRDFIPSNGFSRRDHLNQHMKGVHKIRLDNLRQKTSSRARAAQSSTAPSTLAIASMPQAMRAPGSVVALGKGKRDEETHERDMIESEVARQLAAERRKTHMLMAEMARMREQNRQERDERDAKERQLREETERWQDKYYGLLREEA